MQILVGLSTGEHIRKADFLPYFLALDKPIGTFISTVHGQSPAEARNILIKQALENKCTHILFLDDDMIYPPDTLMRLLAHDKDIVSALYLLRTYPHFAAAFDKAEEDGRNRHLFLTSNIEGLVKVTNCGLGCVLIKTEIFSKLEKPYVRLGEVQLDGWSDDIGFFNRVSKAGIDIYVDTDIRAGHIVSNVLWPNKVNGKWVSEYKNGNGNIQFPQYVESEANIEKALKIEGWMSNKELFWLASKAKNPKNKIIIEVGSYKGRSARVIADNMPADCILYCIDPWNGNYPSVYPPIDTAVFHEFYENLQDHINKGRVIPHMAYFDKFIIPTKADMIFIDGDHSYEGVKNDIKHAMSMIKADGILCGHDYDKVAWPETVKGVNELIKGINIEDTIWSTSMESLEMVAGGKE